MKAENNHSLAVRAAEYLSASPLPITQLSCLDSSKIKMFTSASQELSFAGGNVFNVNLLHVSTPDDLES